MKAKNILALAKSTAERTYFEKLIEAFSDLFTISIADNYQDKHVYDGLFCFERQELGMPQLLFSFEEKKGYVFAELPPFSDTQKTIDLTQQLTSFYHRLETHFLDHLPYRVAFYDASGAVAYDNHKPSNPFELADDATALDGWIKDQLDSTEKGQLHLPLAQSAFSAILMDSYYKVTSPSGDKGYVEIVQDIKPLLEAYLADSAQALVGWSDVTSGASIASDDFDL
ncbi:hypothetical protein [Streptococcus hyointestinalis]|uniref:hypothetical protein n=1 Tax=Streptococcus hyointestinalis TaxID=1337 RepID=UPI003D0463E6